MQCSLRGVICISTITAECSNYLYRISGECTVLTQREVSRTLNSFDIQSHTCASDVENT